MVAEQLRRILLKEMGVTSWFPRSQLPGAAASHEPCLQNYAAGDIGAETRGAETGAGAGPAALHTIDRKAVRMTEAVEDSTGASAPAADSGRSSGQSGPAFTPSALSQPAQVSGVAGLAQLLQQKPAGAQAVAAPPARNPDASDLSPDQAADEVRQRAPLAVADDGSAAITNDAPAVFAFSWFNIDRRLAVLAMLPEGQTRLSGSCRQMLMRILAALHAPWQSLRPVEQSFHWPFADDLGLPADAGAARQAVDGFIAGRLREQKCGMLLVLSDDSPWFFRQPGENAGQSGSLRVHRQFGFAMLGTHSLHAMEQDAGLKRDAWQAMQLLRERLNRDSNQLK